MIATSSASVASGIAPTATIGSPAASTPRNTATTRVPGGGAGDARASSAAAAGLARVRDRRAHAALVLDEDLDRAGAEALAGDRDRVARSVIVSSPRNRKSSRPVSYAATSGRIAASCSSMQSSSSENESTSCSTL